MQHRDVYRSPHYAVLKVYQMRLSVSNIVLQSHCRIIPTLLLNSASLHSFHPLCVVMLVINLQLLFFNRFAHLLNQPSARAQQNCHSSITNRTEKARTNDYPSLSRGIALIRARLVIVHTWQASQRQRSQPPPANLHSLSKTIHDGSQVEKVDRVTEIGGEESVEFITREAYPTLA